MFATRVATTTDIEVIQHLADAQTRRIHALDARLPARLQLPSWLALPSTGTCWLAENGRRVVGALCAEYEHWPSESAFANVFPRRYLRLRAYLADDVPSSLALETLLGRADGWPEAITLPGRMIMTPKCDESMAAALRELGFRSYHAIAHRLMDETPPPAVDGVVVRPAALADLTAVAELMAESWRFHARYQPAIVLSDSLLAGCEHQAWQMAGDGLTQLLLVAEVDGTVVGFFGAGMIYQEVEQRPALFATGHYGDIHEVAVRGDLRRRGVGQTMYRAAWQWIKARGADGVFVNYAPTNPLSSRFWPKLGFQDAWINWWRPDATSTNPEAERSAHV